MGCKNFHAQRYLKLTNKKKTLEHVKKCDFFQVSAYYSGYLKFFCFPIDRKKYIVYNVYNVYIQFRGF